MKSIAAHCPASGCTAAVTCTGENDADVLTGTCSFCGSNVEYAVDPNSPHQPMRAAESQATVVQDAPAVDEQPVEGDDTVSLGGPQVTDPIGGFVPAYE